MTICPPAPSPTYIAPPLFDGQYNMTIPGRGLGTLLIQFLSQCVPYDVSASLLYFEVAGLLRIALGPAPTEAEFTASIAGSTLTVTGVDYGALAIGQVVEGVAPGTTITALGTGTGGVGTYTVSFAQALAPTPLQSHDPSIRTLSFDDAQIAVLPQFNPFVGTSVTYAIRDETGVVPQGTSLGLITVQGFTAQPPPGPA